MRDICDQCGRSYYDFGIPTDCCPQCCAVMMELGCANCIHNDTPTQDQEKRTMRVVPNTFVWECCDCGNIQYNETRCEHCGTMEFNPVPKEMLDAIKVENKIREKKQ